MANLAYMPQPANVQIGAAGIHIANGMQLLFGGVLAFLEARA